MSYELKTNTATRLPVGPLVDPTDGITAETGLDVTALSVQLYQMKTDGSAVVRTQFAPTASGGDNDMILVPSSTDAMYDLELTATQLNFLGNGRITFYDVDGFLVHFIDLHIVSANYFENKYGSTIETVNTIQISGDSTAADNCESFFDGTGYAGTNNVIPTVTVLTGHTVQTGDSFARIGAAGAGLTAIDLPNQTMDITGSLSGSVGSVTGNVDGTVAGVTPATAANVNTEVSDVMKTDTIAEMAQGVPPTTPTFEEAVMYIYQALTKRLDVTATEKAFYNEAGTKVWKKTLSDDSTTYSETKGASGA